MGNRERVVKLEERRKVPALLAEEQFTEEDLEEARRILRPCWPAIAFELAAQGIPRAAAKAWLIDGLSLEDALDSAQ